MPLLDEYQMPNVDLDPQEMERLRAMAMMRLGFGMAGREPIGSAMQAGINTMFAGQEDARRQALAKAKLAMEQQRYAAVARKEAELSSLLGAYDQKTLEDKFGVPKEAFDIAIATRDPKILYDYMKAFDLGEGGGRFVGKTPTVLRGKGGLLGQFINGQEVGQVLQHGAAENAAVLAEAAALGKGRGEAETSLQEVPVAGGRPGQTELVSRAQVLREAARSQQPPLTTVQTQGPYPMRVAPEVQAQRDQGRMSILQAELADAVAQGNKTNIAAISKEIEIMNNKNIGGATLIATNRRVKDPVAQREAEARIPSTPEGYRWTDKGLEQVPGGPKDTSEQEKLKITNAVNRADLVMKKVDEVKNSVDWTTVGPASKLVGWVPGTPQYDLKKNVDMLKANIGFQELAAMRAASPTGGALGQVALQELDMLQSTLGSLDTSQSPAEMKKNLDNVMTHFNNWKRTMEQSGEKFSPPKSPKPQEVSIDDLVNKYRK